MKIHVERRWWIRSDFCTFVSQDAIGHDKNLHTTKQLRGFCTKSNTHTHTQLQTTLASTYCLLHSLHANLCSKVVSSLQPRGHKFVLKLQSTNIKIKTSQFYKMTI